MNWLAVAEALLGVVVVGVVVRDAFRVVVMPRPYYGRSVSKFLFQAGWRVWRQIGLRRTRVQPREDVLGIFPQIALLLLLAYWGCGLILGYGLILHALRDQIEPVPSSFGEVVYFAGVSILTLGFGEIVPVGGGARVVTLVTAASGPALVGLVLALLFSLNASYQSREALITTLDAAAGAPPSGVRLLETYGLLEMHDQLPALFRDWEVWTAGVLDSHLDYPLLAFFRSSHDNESWISALGAVLDAATLMVASEVGSVGNARLMYDVGCHAVEDLSNYFGLVHEHEVGVEQQEFDEAMIALRQAGYQLAPPAASWERFRALRTAYAGPLNALATLLVTPPALWIGDRSNLHSAVDRD